MLKEAVMVLFKEAAMKMVRRWIFCGCMAGKQCTDEEHDKKHRRQLHDVFFEDLLSCVFFFPFLSFLKLSWVERTLSLPPFFAGLLHFITTRRILNERRSFIERI